MKDHNFFRSLGELAVGKGFYIVLALCIAAAGVSGYYLMDAVTAPLEEPQRVDNPTPVTIPDPEPDPVIRPDPAPVQPVQKPQEAPLPKEESPADPQEKAPAQPKVEKSPALSVPTVFTWPVKGEVLRGFSVETLSPDPTMGDWRTHPGMDVAAKLGTRVLCMTEGLVSEIWEDERMGTCVKVEHGGELVSVYANLAPQPTIKVGDKLEIGAILGAVGDTAGAESGMAPHLHLEVFRADEPIDPMELLPE